MRIPPSGIPQGAANVETSIRMDQRLHPEHLVDFVPQVVAGAGIEEVESGGAAGSTRVSNKGDLVNQCVTSGNFANSGNAVGAGAVSQYQTETDDIGIGGSTIEFGNGIAGECTQTIEVK